MQCCFVLLCIWLKVFLCYVDCTVYIPVLLTVIKHLFTRSVPVIQKAYYHYLDIAKQCEAKHFSG